MRRKDRTVKTAVSAVTAGNSRSRLRRRSRGVRSFILNGRNLARPKRFERVTSTFGGWRSIQLSYGRIFIIAYAVLTRRSRENNMFVTDLASSCFLVLFQSPASTNWLDICLRRQRSLKKVRIASKQVDNVCTISPRCLIGRSLAQSEKNSLAAVDVRRPSNGRRCARLYARALRCSH